MTKASEFYDGLNIIPSFRNATDHKLYTPLPDTWYVALADIRNSTDAIRKGSYKEVNMAGASIIAALNNHYQNDEVLPYLFGGDGSLIVLPDNDIEVVKAKLAFCKKAVKDAYDLDMATGVISMKELRELGHDIGIAKLQLSEFINQTIFWGSGVTVAEEMIKEQDLLEGIDPITADFTGLECRWGQIPSNKDEVAAYIIQAYDLDDEESVQVYGECFQKIEEIYGDEEDFHPIKENALKMTSNPFSLSAEWKLKTQPPSLSKKIKLIIKMMFQFVTGFYLMKFQKKTSKTDWGDYKPDLIRHADYKKFGDGLRFVASGTIEQRMQLTQYLESKFAEKKLAYGVHTSFAAMVTCYVRSYQSDHIHFVDGSDGGYAKASQELKNRRAQLKAGKAN